jgi:TrmH family RNA methyltransferase
MSKQPAMISNNQIKYIRSFNHKKTRQRYDKIIVEGVKISYEILNEQLTEVTDVFALREWIELNNSLLDAQIRKTVIREAELKKISNLKTPNQVLMIVRKPEISPDTSLPENALCLFLESIRDPGNLGTILRIADWFGYKSVFLSPDCVDPFNPKVIQSSMTSIFRLRLGEADLGIFKPGKFPILACDLIGQSVFNMQPPSNGLLVFGNESKGISNQTRKLASHIISVPGERSLGADSLNVATAAAVICGLFSIAHPA